MAVGVNQQVLGHTQQPVLWSVEPCAGCQRNEQTYKHFMAQVPGSFSISKMLRKETHDILMVQGIKLLSGICVIIHQSVHLFHSSEVIDVSPCSISTLPATANHSCPRLAQRAKRKAEAIGSCRQSCAR